MKASFFMPIKAFGRLSPDNCMKEQYGVQVFGLCNPNIRKLIPPMFTLPDAERPVFYACVENTRRPGFAPAYMSAGIGVICTFEKTTGIYFFSQMICGKGALTAACRGREKYGFPMKICDNIFIQCVESTGRCYVERDGVRLMDIKVRLGAYNTPDFDMAQETCTPKSPMDVMEHSFSYRYPVRQGMPEGMDVMTCDSRRRYYSWEKASVSIALRSSDNDPWGEIKVRQVLGAAWVICDHHFEMRPAYACTPWEIEETMPYLFAGRNDISRPM